MCNAYREQADQLRKVYTSLQSAVSTIEKDRARKLRNNLSSITKDFSLFVMTFLMLCRITNMQETL